MSSGERERFERDGFLVRESVFNRAEVEALRDAAEQVSDLVRITADPTAEITMGDGHRIERVEHAWVQWEWAEGSHEIRLVEPFTHLDSRFADAARDPRLVEPMADALGIDEAAPFTSKLNFKRALEGSEFPYHQDFPYWFMTHGEQARDVVTSIVFLDGATADNGAIHVLPGSHHGGPAARDPDDGNGFVADVEQLDTSGEVTVEVPAGSVLMFGSLLVHRSSPNRSDRHRRAMLLSYQPPGRPTHTEIPYDFSRFAEIP